MDWMTFFCVLAGGFTIFVAVLWFAVENYFLKFYEGRQRSIGG